MKKSITRIIALAISLIFMFSLVPFSTFANPVSSTRKKGIDVSKWQGNIDWDTVKSKIDFAIIRVGVGSNSTDNDDPKFVRNANECTRLGIPFGVYIYSCATTAEGAQSEADHVLRLISGYNLSLPVFYDLEDSKTVATVSNATILAMAKAFCSRISAAGYVPGIYANYDWWTHKLTSSDYDAYPRWVARYNKTCGYGKDYVAWQYSQSGTISGISGSVDMDYWYGDFIGSVDTTPPTVSGASVSNITASGYDVSCNISDDTGVTRVRFATWTEANGQDDLVWADGTISGSRATYRVNASDHGGQTGNYVTHIYAYDARGNQSEAVTTGTVNVQNPETGTPVFYNWRVTDISSSGYTVYCDVSNYVSGYDVLYASWTVPGGQDDLTWNTAGKSGNTFSYRVNTSDHNGRYNCKYTTHIYYRYNNALTLIGSVGEFMVGDYKTVTYDANGGTGAPNPQSFYGGAALSAGQPSKSLTLFYTVDGSTYHSDELECSFVNWNTDISGTGASYNPGNEYYGPTATLHAMWSNPTLTSFPSDPIKQGYTFDGWYTQATGGTRVSAGTAITADTELFAHWSANDENYFYTAHKALSAPSVDGCIGDGEYQGAMAYSFTGSDINYYASNYERNKIWYNNGVTKIGDSTVYVTWTDGGLYVAGSIADRTVSSVGRNTDLGSCWLGSPGLGLVGDTVTVMFRKNNANTFIRGMNDDPVTDGAENTVAFTIHPFPAGSGTTNGSVRVGNVNSPVLTETWLSRSVLSGNGVQVSANGTGEGYVFEYYIPKNVIEGIYREGSPSVGFSGISDMFEEGALSFSVLVSDGYEGATIESEDGGTFYAPATNSFYNVWTDSISIGASYASAPVCTYETTYVLASFSSEAHSVTFVDDEPTPSIKGSTLTVESDLTVNYYCELAGKYTSSKMRFVREGGDPVIVEPSGIEDGYYKFSFTGLSMKFMSDRLDAELIYEKDGEEQILDAKYEYSIRQYCNNIYQGDSGNERLATLLADLLVYGDAAQLYDNYRTDSLPSSGFDWVGICRSQTDSDPSVYAVKTSYTAVDPDNKILSARLVLGYVNYIDFKIKMTGEGPYSFVLRRNGNIVGTYGVSDLVVYGSEYYIRTPAIRATEYDDVFNLEMFVGENSVHSVSFNMAAYVNSNYNSTYRDGKLAVLLRALYNFGTSARLYLGR